MVKEMWDNEIAEEKENCSQKGDSAGSSVSSSGLRYPIDPDTMTEAYEDYMFDHMMRYDGDAAHLLVHFRASLRVVPESAPHGEMNEFAQRRDRTNELFEGLRRVYFGTKEGPPPEPAIELSQ